MKAALLAVSAVCLLLAAHANPSYDACGAGNASQCAARHIRKASSYYSLSDRMALTALVVKSTRGLNNGR